MLSAVTQVTGIGCCGRRKSMLFSPLLGGCVPPCGSGLAGGRAFGLPFINLAQLENDARYRAGLGTMESRCSVAVMGLL